MEQNAEYHDPDYPGVSNTARQERPTLTDEERIQKIKNITLREFANEINYKKDELNVIDQRVTKARRMLQQLRYNVVNQYYNEQKLMLTADEVRNEVAAQNEPTAKAEVKSILCNDQKRIHPSLKKLLGKNTTNLEEIFKFRSPRNKTRKNYMAMVTPKNQTIPAEGNMKSLRPEIKQESTNTEPQQSVTEVTITPTNKKVPRYIPPKITNVFSMNEATRNQNKQRYRIIIGNTSKYAPPSSKVDRSTHKWLLYVRGPPTSPDISAIVTGVSATLHDTYSPHHQVHVDKPPFHISRRGWGEFPAKVCLHFTMPKMNRPVSLEHTIKLDRNYTGLQTLGAETVVDVWLYSNEEMLKFEYKMDQESTAPEVPIVEEPKLCEVKEEVPDLELGPPGEDNSWMDFFTNQPKELDVDEMIIKTIKTEKVDEHNDLETQIDSSVIKKELDWSHMEMNGEVVSKIKSEPPDKHDDDLGMDLLNADMPNEVLNPTTPPKKRIMKYLDPNTGKIYYLEMDRNLDISKVQEIIIKSKGNKKMGKASPLKAVPNGAKSVKKLSNKGGMSLLKPEVKCFLNTSVTKSRAKDVAVNKNNYAHIENDHCYISVPKHLYRPSEGEAELPDQDTCDKADDGVAICENVLDTLCKDIARFTCIRVAVNYLLSRIPLICKGHRPEFPFAVNSEEKYWMLDVIKRRNIQWSRAKLVNTLLSQHFKHGPIWRTKQILLYARLHGFYPIKPERKMTENIDEWSSWYDLEKARNLQSNIKEIYPNVDQINSLSKFQNGDYSEESGSVIPGVDLTADEDVDVLNVGSPLKEAAVQSERSDLTLLPVVDEDERLRFLYIEKKCADLDIELRNEDVGNGYSYSAVHALMLCAVKKYAEELIRSALCQQQLQAETEDRGLPTVWNSGEQSERPLVELQHVYQATRLEARLDMLTGSSLGIEPSEYHPI